VSKPAIDAKPDDRGGQPMESFVKMAWRVKNCWSFRDAKKKGNLNWGKNLLSESAANRLNQQPEFVR